MTVIHSAGILLHRRTAAGVEVLIAHMGGPFWARKEAGAWSIPKGEHDPASEPPRDAAIREFREELGLDAPAAGLVELGEFRYASGKRVTVFATDGSGLDASDPVFGTFEMEWPPRSGRVREFPEVDRVEWTPLPLARERLVAGQRAVLDVLEAALGEA